MASLRKAQPRDAAAPGGGCACARSRFTVVYVIAAVALAGAVLFIVAGWLERVRGLPLAEDAMPASSGSRRPGPWRPAG